MDPMKNALSQRKGKSMDITVLLNGQPLLEGQGGPADPKSDLAPPPDPATPGDESMAPPPGDAAGAAPLPSAGADAAAPPNPALPQDDGMEEAMLGGMSDQDKAGLMSRKPRSLGEHARAQALSKK